MLDVAGRRRLPAREPSRFARRFSAHHHHVEVVRHVLIARVCDVHHDLTMSQNPWPHEAPFWKEMRLSGRAARTERAGVIDCEGCGTATGDPYVAPADEVIRRRRTLTG